MKPLELDSIILHARRHRLCAKVQRNLEVRCGWSVGQSVLVGLSGGVDSTALLVIASVLAARQSPQSSVGAVYVHHHLRSEADLEAEHCAKLCERLGVKFTVVDVHPRVGPSGLADDARRLRHAALDDCARRNGARWILLAHHVDDVLETLLMRIGRGAGTRGLSTIPWVRRSKPRSEICIARPLLASNRSEIEEFCRACQVTWCEDPSNAKLESARGLLRDQVVPILRARWPGIARHALGVSEAGRSGEWALREIAKLEGWNKCDIPRRLLRTRGPVLSAALLASGFRLQGLSISLRTIREVAEAACDGTTRPRTFQDEGGIIVVRARALMISAPERFQGDPAE